MPHNPASNQAPHRRGFFPSAHAASRSRNTTQRTIISRKFDTKKLMFCAQICI